ncbi:MAG TPA: ABC transporter substrate-binding protein [Longimicrobiales bacterium]|nr:ABC transporter substrate-binding protein [Longimicrobiales bacterium]
MEFPVRAWAGVLVAAALAACGGDSGARGGTIIVGMRSDFGGFNPITSSSTYDQALNNHALFTPLISYDEDLHPQPFLAESWELLGDTGIVFRLRQDVRWHDGQPVTAHDVLFTFEVAKNPESASLVGSSFLAEVESARVLDDHTIAFSFVRPHAQAIENFYWAPAPRHLLQDVAPAELRNAPFNRQPVGSGPFRFGSWRANEQLVLERNPDFPEALGGPAAADRVVFRIIPESSTMLTELFTGSIDVDIPVTPEQVRQIESNGETELFSFPGRSFHYIGWNNARPPFDDARVRRAMTMAINRQEVIDALLYGQGQLATGPIPPWHPLDPGVDPLPFDPDAAGRLLEEAGWTPGPDGIRRNAQGQPLSFTMMSSDDALRRAVVEVVQNQLRRVGADVQVRVTEFQTMLQNHRNRDFDAVFTNWSLDNFNMASAPMSLFHTSQAEIEQSPNRSSVRIPQLDAAMERAMLSPSESDQQAAWAEFTRVLQEEQPFTFMFWLNELAAARNWVDGIRMDPRGDLLTIGEWTVNR